ncbi:MAG TPA: zf-HC2 domain-containing protein [Pyrinomonadaceae bacterium]|nr:zf-HC2 domain-containing protein [Pyrinomonadaceae bacterium]
MTRCLDQATLQSYFDGELSGEMMERASLHLASCSTCAAAAREMEEEIGLLMTALAPDFEASVPTERLRQQIDAAVLDLRIGAASSRERTGFGAFISSLLSFGTQRTLGYASLVMVLAFAAIFGLVKFKTTPQEPIAETQPVMNADKQVAQTPPEAPAAFEPVQVNTPVARNNTDKRAGIKRNRTPKSELIKSEPVKLLPGERSYLQTIARLDSTIKANQKSMRPSLQVEYERNLAVVDRAIAATRSAAKSNPNDPDAADFMFAAYQSKVDLLNTIADARLGGGRSQ